MSPDAGRGIRGSWARVGGLATTLALAFALVVSSWLNYRAARAAVQTLHLGQAELHASALRSADPRGFGVESEPAALEAVLESQREAGLRYIAVVDLDGSVATSVGESVGEIGLPPGFREGARYSGPILLPVGDRVRAYLPRPPDRVVFRGGGFRGQGRDSAFAGRTGGGGGGGFGMQFFLLEFEPIPASDVVSRAVSGLFLNGLGALLLTLVALGFWRVTRGYEAAQEQIEQQKRLSQLGEMSAVLAHEIRNPLASLKGNAQLLAESFVPGSREKRKADRVVNEAIRLEALTTDLLAFARTARIVRTAVDPAHLLRTAAADVAPDGISIEADHAPDRWYLDPARLRQALANLVRNAYQISPDGRPPVARVYSRDRELVFEIRDFGPGIAAPDRDRIFEPFFTTRTQGTGLGLSVAKRVAEMHGGRLEAGNHPDGGAVFSMVLPSGDA